MRPNTIAPKPPHLQHQHAQTYLILLLVGVISNAIITVDLKHDRVLVPSSSVASIAEVIPCVFYLDVLYRQLRVIIRHIRTIFWNDPILFRPRDLWRGAANEFSEIVYKRTVNAESLLLLLLLLFFFLLLLLVVLSLLILLLVNCTDVVLFDY